MCSEDVFPDKVMIRGPPEFSVSCFICTRGEIARRRKIIHQCVEPDIGDEIFVEGEGDPPGEPVFGAGDTEVA